MSTEFAFPTTRAELVAQVESEHADLVSLVDSVPEAQREQPLVGAYSLKDILAHITDWEDYLLLRLRSALAGDPVPPRIVHESDLDRINAETFAAHHLEDWHGVRYEFDRTFQEVCVELANLPETGLSDPANGFAIVGLEEASPMQVIVDNTAAHYREHAEEIRRGLRSI